MIKECFQDDENKCKELLTMISESIFQKNLEGLSYKERAEIEMNNLNQKIEQKDQQLEQAENKNNELRKEIEQLKKQLTKG